MTSRRYNGSMKSANEKTTLYLDPRVKRAVQFYALRERRSLSSIVEEKLLDYLEDMSDIEAVKATEGEPAYSFEEVAKALGLSLDEIQTHVKKEREKDARKAKSAD